MNGECKDRFLLGEDCGGAISVMHIRIDDHGLLNRTVGLQSTNGDGDVVNGTETFAVTGMGMMKAAAKVAAKTIAKGRLRSGNRSAGGQPEGTNKLRGIGDFELHDIAEGEGTSLQLADPVFGVNTQNIRVGGWLGAEEIGVGSDAILHQLVGDEAVLLGRKHVGAEVQIITLVVDKLEGKHVASYGNREEKSQELCSSKRGVI